MSEEVYVVIDDLGTCLGVFTDLALANGMAKYYRAKVSHEQLIHSQQDMYQRLYNDQIASKQ